MTRPGDTAMAWLITIAFVLLLGFAAMLIGPS